MAVDQWPASLPQHLLVSTVTGGLREGRLVSQMDQGPAKVRRRSSAMPDLLNGSIIVQDTQLLVLEAFVKTTLLDGSLPFTLPDPVRFSIDGSRALVRFVELPSWKALGNKLFEVTLALEVLANVPALPPEIVASALPVARQGEPFAAPAPSVRHGARPLKGFSIATGALPEGLSLDPTTGAISGTPTRNGIVSNFTVRVADALDRVADLALTLTPRAPAFIFAAGRPIDPTVSRASTAATFFGADGVLRVAAANELRIDHDPVTRVVRGALIEEARTNAFLNSEGPLSTYASPTNTSQAATTIAGFANAILLRSDGNGNGNLRKQATTVAGATVVLSAFLEVLDDLGAPVLSVAPSQGDVSLGIENSLAGLDGLHVERAGSRLYRISVRKLSATGQTNALSGFFFYTAQRQRQFKATGLQIEVGSTTSSYIPTTTASVTRPADQVSFDLPAGTHELTYTFDDGSTFVAPGASGTVTIPTNLPRRHVRRIDARATS